jgi:hypothetical protein
VILKHGENFLDNRLTAWYSSGRCEGVAVHSLTPTTKVAHPTDLTTNSTVCYTFVGCFPPPSHSAKSGGRPNNPVAQAPFLAKRAAFSSGDVARSSALHCAPWPGFLFACAQSVAAPVPSQLKRDDDHLYSLVPAWVRWERGRAAMSGPFFPPLKSLILAQDERWRRA